MPDLALFSDDSIGGGSIKFLFKVVLKCRDGGFVVFGVNCPAPVLKVTVELICR